MFPISEKTIQKLINKGKHLIDSHTVISFDVFDTLLTRDCSQPSDVFDLVEESYNKREKNNPLNDFKNLRKEVEKKCAHKTIAPNLDEIYAHLPLDEEKKSKLKAIEIEIEQAISIRKYTGYTLYHYAKKQGKRIVAVSDMYLGKDAINKMLISAGYTVDDIFVSCDNSAEKYNGKLFHVVITKLSVSKTEIVHFGDNIITDIVGAMRAGISCLWIPARKNLTYFKRCGDSFADRFLFPFVANRVPLIDNKVTALGYETCGPMIVGFCQWIHQKLHEGSYNKALFCARDMLQTYQIYMKMFPEDKDLPCYFYVSRNSLKTAYRAITGEDTSEESNIQLQYLRSYLKQLGCKGKVALIDGGLTGRPQKMLTTIMAGELEIHGLYMRIAKPFFLNVQDPETYMYMYSRNPETKHMIGAQFFETLTSAVHGRTKCYMKDSFGKIIPQLGQDNPSANQILSYQKGAELFASEYIDSYFGDSFICPKAVQNVMLQLAFFPQYDDVSLLKDLKSGDTNYEKIVIQKEKSYYIFHWLDFLRDLKKTYWKGGFLRYYFFCFSPIVCIIYLWLDCLILDYIGTWPDSIEPK